MNSFWSGGRRPAGISLARLRAGWWCLAAYLVIAVADVVSEALALRLPAAVLPVISMPLLGSFVALTMNGSRLRRLLLIALIFAWFGDALGFSVLLKIIFFVGTQIAYCVAFWPLRRRSLLARRGPLVIFTVIMTTLVILMATRADSLELPVIIYGVLLSLMVALASGVSRLTTAGAALFLISDITLGYLFFINAGESPWLGALVMGTYLPAQLLIVLGVARHAANEDATPMPLGGPAAEPA